MRPSEKKYAMSGVIGLALMLSTTACTSSEPAAEATPSSATQSSSASATPTATATPSVAPTPSSTPMPSPAAPMTEAPAPAAAPETSPAAEAPPAPAPVAPQPASPGQDPGAPSKTLNITTPEQAIELIRKEDDYNPDFQYIAAPDPEGEEGFEVIVRSISLSAGGGSGTVEVWQVYPDGNYSRDN